MAKELDDVQQARRSLKQKYRERKAGKQTKYKPKVGRAKVQRVRNRPSPPGGRI